MSASELYIRDARKDELDEIVHLETLAFRDDPIANYCGSVKQPMTMDKNDPDRIGSDMFHYWLTNVTWAYGGRVDVMVDPKGPGGKEKIVGVACWFPPNARPNPGHLITMIKCGFLSIAWHWGITGLLRMPRVLAATEETMKLGFGRRNLKQPPETTWYLQCICVHPDYQGKSVSSRLIRHAFEREAPGTVFTLDATSDKSMPRYRHVGFELLGEAPIGQGEVLKSGLPAPKGSKEEKPGFCAYSMVYIKPQPPSSD